MADNEKMSDDEARESEFVRLLTSHQLDIYLYVHSLMPVSDEAEEVLQETNIALLQKRGQFDATRDFRAWAFQFARNKVLQYRDQRKRKCICFSDTLLDELAIQAPKAVKANNDVVDDLRDCVARLASQDRELLGMRYSKMTTCAAIAKKVGRPIAWAYNALRRIRKELLDCMTRHAAAGKNR